MGSSAASNSSASIFGGSPDTAETRLWNGTAWFTNPNMNEARSSLKGAGTESGMIACSGDPVGIQDVEEFSEVTTAAEPVDIDFD